MNRFLVFGRRGYAEPLAQIGERSADSLPSVKAVGLGDDWLELVVIPEDAIIWVIRDAELVDERTGVTR